jgi:DNA-binding protein H-NS
VVHYFDVGTSFNDQMGLGALRELIELNMRNANLRSMSVDELWELHEAVVAELAQKIAAERSKLETRLRKLGAAGKEVAPHERRPYPKVIPKYCNPKNRSETWAGRGKQPRWLTAQLQAGKRLSDFLIRHART